jgi:hypothetical protein
MLGARVTITDEPTLIYDASRETNPRYPGACVIKNPADSGAVVDLGGEDVATGAGYELAVGEAVGVQLIHDAIYGVTATGTVELHVLRRD